VPVAPFLDVAVEGGDELGVGQQFDSVFRHDGQSDGVGVLGDFEVPGFSSA
jgi:hypothetical protein